MRLNQIYRHPKAEFGSLFQLVVNSRGHSNTDLIKRNAFTTLSLAGFEEFDC